MMAAIHPPPMAHILILDDEPGMRFVVKRILAAHGHTVCEAADWFAGSAACRGQRPDLILSDLIMPSTGFLEFVGLRHGRFPETPVIAMTGIRDGDCHRGIARALGATATVLKPFSAEELVAAVNDALADAAVLA
jgi:CheY-like chemotaxis protein